MKQRKKNNKKDIEQNARTLRVCKSEQSRNSRILYYLNF